MSETDQESDIGDVDLLSEVQDVFNAAKNKEIDEIDPDNKTNAESGSDDDDLEYEETDEKKSLKKIKMHNVTQACDSRLPDVMSHFEYTQLVIAGAALIMKGGTPLISVPGADPVAVAKMQIMMRKSNQSVLRVDPYGNHCEWRVKDFAHFPANAVEEFDELVKAHFADHREWLDSMSPSPDTGS
jgi:hypothetical protein